MCLGCSTPSRQRPPPWRSSIAPGRIPPTAVAVSVNLAGSGVHGACRERASGSILPRLDGVNGGPNEGLVEGLEVVRALEGDVGGVLGLVDAGAKETASTVTPPPDAAAPGQVE